MTRLKLAWNVLRGRPVMYRMKMRDGTIHTSEQHQGARVVECEFRDYSHPVLMVGKPERYQ